MVIYKCSHCAEILSGPTKSLGPFLYHADREPCAQEHAKLLTMQTAANEARRKEAKRLAELEANQPKESDATEATPGDP